MSERNSDGDEIQVDEIKEFIGANGVKIIEEDGQSKVSFDFASLPEVTSDISPDTDYTVIYDASASAHKKTLIRDLPSSSAAVGTFQLNQQVFGGGLRGTTNGAHTWNKPAGTKAVYVLVIGAGGGGGSGRRGAVSSYRTGGGGGAGGCVSEFWFNGAALPSSVTITCGLGGLGAAGQTVDSSNGLSGAAGGNSSFGDYLQAAGGGGGTGGVASSAVANAGDVGTIGWGFGAGGNGDDGNGDTPPTPVFGPAGGGGGGGTTNGNTVYGGGIGGRVPFSMTAGVSAPGVGGTGQDGPDPRTIPWFGGGAAGGGSSNTANAGGGGNAYGGGGGGGGGGSLNLYTSGPGGNGGDGMVIVLSFF